MSQVLGTPVNNLTPRLTDSAGDGRFTTTGWGKGHPLYARGNV